MSDKYFIVKDTREKKGWDFEPRGRCLGTDSRPLKTGDYTASGQENSICIERKASVSELSTNLIQKKEPFHRELERMDEYDYAYIICEFPLSDLVKYPDIPSVAPRVKKQIRITGKYLLKLILEIEAEHPYIKFIFADDPETAKYYAACLLTRLTKDDIRDL